MTFVELVEAVAKETQLPKATVSKTLKSFQTQVGQALESGERVKLAGFGAFYSVTLKPRPGLFGRVSESKSTIRFKESRSRSMEKYSVQLDDEKTKTAGEGKTCPQCGATLSQPCYCDTCGTKPFEKRTQDSK
jgi:nucleoid DNA-binding protein